MGLTVHFEVLNQLGTPMMHSATLANRPAAGITGRIFFRTDSPYGIYRDTGSVWDQISGTSTFSGSLAAGQVAFGSATDTIAGNNNLFWNNTNANLGIGSNSVGSVWKLGVDGNIATTGFLSLGPLTGSASNAYIQVTSTQLQILAAASRYISFSANSNEYARLATTGNFIIGSPFTDVGQRLQVYGDTFLKGSGATSGTTALQIQNSDGTISIRVINDGKLAFGNLNSSAYPFICTINGTTTTPDQNGSSLLFTTNNANNSNGGPAGFLYNASYQPGSGGIPSLIRYIGTFAVSTGSAGVAVLDLQYTINQTGTANGTTRGLYIRPTLTSAVDWRSIEWSNNTGFGLYGAGTAANYLGGSLGIKTTAIYSPSTFSLDVNGGLLIKNTAGTTAQITLINADPSVGGNNGFLVNSVGGTSGSSYVDLQGYYGTSITGSTALRLNPAGGPVIINSTTNSGEQFQLTGSIRINGQSSGTSGGNSGQHLIINLDGTTYKIRLELP